MIESESGVDPIVQIELPRSVAKVFWRRGQTTDEQDEILMMACGAALWGYTPEDYI